MMRAVFSFVTVCVAAAMVGVTISGCGSEAPSNTNNLVASQSPAQPTPEQSFKRIVELFSNAIDTNDSGVRTGFVFRGEDGHSSMSVRKEVTNEFIPPAKEGEPYRGTITVTSHMSYSMRMTPDDSSDKKSGTADQTDFSDPTTDDGVDVLDSDLLAPAKRNNGPAASDEVVARRTEEDVRTYELEYDNDHWVLKTELDPNTEQSIQFAFDHILGNL